MVRECHRNVASLSCWEAKVLEPPSKLVVNPQQASLWGDAGGNLLPYDGIAEYYPQFFSHIEAVDVFNELLATMPWEQDEVVLFGQRRVLSRKVAWVGDENFCYSYSGTSKTASRWTKPLLCIKERVERRCSHAFNSCLLNLYHDGAEGMGWHSDDEKTLGRNPVISSLSLGSERVFKLKHKQSQEVVSMVLENGSLLVMKGETQHHWVHTVPKTKKFSTPRINLTFRYFVGTLPSEEPLVRL